MNAVITSISIMLILSFLRINIVLSMLIGALAGAVFSGLDLTVALNAFSNGLGSGANIALSYGMLGAFALSISASRIPDYFIMQFVDKLKHSNKTKKLKYILILCMFLLAVLSQNVFPIHIAFIPILVPPLLPLLNKLKIDRRLIAVALTTGLTATYLVVPVGFGDIYLTKVLHHNLTENGLYIDSSLMSKAMLIPVLGMILGFLFSIYKYKNSRNYITNNTEEEVAEQNNNLLTSKPVAPTKLQILTILISIISALAVQLITGSMIVCSAVGCTVLLLGGVTDVKKSDHIFNSGMKNMAVCGFIMIAAAGFAEVLRETGDIDQLVTWITYITSGNKAIGAFIMLVVGLLITMGIGSSFSTVPIIASLYVPLAVALGFSPLATACLVGAAGALGDAGSPASESTIGPTIGLNTDGKHDHIKDTVIPTFLYLNIPMIIFSWVAVMLL